MQLISFRMKMCFCGRDNLCLHPDENNDVGLFRDWSPCHCDYNYLSFVHMICSWILVYGFERYNFTWAYCWLQTASQTINMRKVWKVGLVVIVCQPALGYFLSTFGHYACVSYVVWWSYFLGELWVCCCNKMESCHLWGVHEIKSQGKICFLNQLLFLAVMRV